MLQVGIPWALNSLLITALPWHSSRLISVFSYPAFHQIPQQPLVYRPVFGSNAILDSLASQNLINAGQELAMRQVPCAVLQLQR